jgi:2'-5' RNA ligase
LAKLIAPHITLVYPFDSPAPMTVLRDHVGRVARRFRTFVASCAGISVVEGEYVFLNVVAGAEELVRIHRALYRGELHGFAPSHYNPHITVARTRNRSTLGRAVETASAHNFDFAVEVSSICAYWIDPELPRQPAFEIALGDER